MVLRLPWEPGIVFHLSQSLSLYPKVRNNFLLHFLPSCRLYQTIVLDLQPIFRFLEYSFLTKYTIIFHQGPFHRISFPCCLAKKKNTIFFFFFFIIIFFFFFFS